VAVLEWQAHAFLSSGGKTCNSGLFRPPPNSSYLYFRTGLTSDLYRAIFISLIIFFFLTEKLQLTAYLWLGPHRKSFRASL
jgi:hypothetical protein